MSNDIVPFGKYKDQPVEMLIADNQYRDWLLSQPWFRDRFVNLYQTVINYGGPPQDSPEHNEMQVAFLNDDLCWRLARKIWPGRVFERSSAEREIPPFHRKMIETHPESVSISFDGLEVIDRKFEDGGWDVSFGISSPWIFVRAKMLPACTCKEDDTKRSRAMLAEPRTKLEFGSRPYSYDHDAPCLWSDDDACHFYLSSRTYSFSEHEYGPNWGGRILAELKPDLGDDFPSVLRQIDRYPRSYRDRLCVIARRANFVKVSFDQVRQIFEASNITLLGESEIA